MTDDQDWARLVEEWETFGHPEGNYDTASWYDSDNDARSPLEADLEDRDDG